MKAGLVTELEKDRDLFDFLVSAALLTDLGSSYLNVASLVLKSYEALEKARFESDSLIHIVGSCVAHLENMRQRGLVFSDVSGYKLSEKGKINFCELLNKRVEFKKFLVKIKLGELKSTGTV